MQCTLHEQNLNPCLSATGIWGLFITVPYLAYHDYNKFHLPQRLREKQTKYFSSLVSEMVDSNESFILASSMATLPPKFTRPPFTGLC